MALTKLTTDLIDGTIVTSVNGSTGAVTLETGGGGIDWQATPKTASFTAIAGEGYFVDSGTAAITVTLPSSPTAGDEVSIVDYGANASTNNITITSSDNIEGAADDLVLSTDKVSKTLVYSDATKGWLATTEAGAGSSSSLASAFEADFLVVAGGGAGGGSYYGGGGGAGGLRTSYGSLTGGGAASLDTLNLSISQSYTVTVGAGGSGNSQASGDSGSNSVFHTITSTGGGGGGGSTNSSADIRGKNGGSGGAWGAYGDNNTRIVGQGSAGQGYDSGGSNGTTNPYSPGGGGAASVGAQGNDTGAGGSGLAVAFVNASNATTAGVGEISGQDVYYAGGGAGSTLANANSANVGGIGGGGNGAIYNSYQNSTQPQGGDANTGGGGGGGVHSGATVGGSGGSGVVMVSYPTDYAVLADAGLTEITFTENNRKITVFTAGTGNISFGAA